MDNTSEIQNEDQQIIINKDHVDTIKNVYNEIKKIIESLYDDNNFTLNTYESIINSEISQRISSICEWVENEGIVIEYYYGTPLYIWTSYGKIRISKGDYCYSGEGYQKHDSLINLIQEKFECTEYIPKIKNITGEFGPVHQINIVNGKRLEPIRIGTKNYTEDTFNERKQIINEFKKLL